MKDIERMSLPSVPRLSEPTNAAYSARVTDDDAA
jgi:hypothetical protein